jgi:hypothetical protein
VAEENKRLRLTLDKVADEWLCAITHELPFHPVMAEDSRVYERNAIEEWFRRNEAVVRSPMTGAPMGRALIAAPQLRNTIESLIEHDANTGDQSEAWRTASLRRRTWFFCGNARRQANLKQCTNSGLRMKQARGNFRRMSSGLLMVQAGRRSG